MLDLKWLPQASAKLLGIARADAEDYIEINTVLAAVRSNGFTGRRWIGTIEGRYRGYLLRPTEPGHVVFVLHDVEVDLICVVDLLPRRPVAPAVHADLLRMAAEVMGIAGGDYQVRR